MDMVDSQQRNSPPQWVGMTPTELTPSTAIRPASVVSFANHPSQMQETRNIFSGGRIPTLRWGHFCSMDMSIDMVDAPIIIPSPPDSPSEKGFHHRRRRRLPSPISEDGDMIISSSMNTASPTGMTEQMMHRLDMRSNQVSEAQPTHSSARWKDPATSNLASSVKGGKLMLSMGYRADCEKCRTRVPGHYNHVVRI